MAMSFIYSFFSNLSLYNLNRRAIQLGFKTDFWTKDKTPQIYWKISKS